eukprot:7760352-Pyramimonas_sp.AAC.1
MKTHKSRAVVGPDPADADEALQGRHRAGHARADPLVEHHPEQLHHHHAVRRGQQLRHGIVNITCLTGARY